MASKKFTELPGATTPVTGDEIIAAVQSGESVQLTLAELVDLTGINFNRSMVVVNTDGTLHVIPEININSGQPNFTVGYSTTSTDNVNQTVAGGVSGSTFDMRANDNNTPVSGYTQLTVTPGEAFVYSTPDQVSVVYWGVAFDGIENLLPAGTFFKVSRDGGPDMILVDDTGTAITGVFRVPVFTTVGRPNAVTAGVGATYYDTTVSKPVWSDGAIWRDAAGAPV